MSTPLILQTAELPWGIAKKTASIRAKPISSLIVDKTVMDKLLIETLEGREPVDGRTLLCLGLTAEPWQQTAKALLKKYQVVGIEEDGWLLCNPLPENEVGYFQITDSMLQFSATSSTLPDTVIIGHWGETIGELKNAQRFKVGDYVCRQEYDHTDQWIVRQSLFEATYSVIQPA